MTATTPTKEARADHQRRMALARANLVRGQRATIKKMLKDAPNLHHAYTRLIALLETDKSLPGLDGMAVRELLKSCRNCGHVRAGHAVRHLKITASRQVGELSERQRGELIEYLRNHS